MENELKNPLIELYGENALEDSFDEIQKLKSCSNISFDNEYMNTGINFMILKANEIIENKKKRIKLSNLVNESFGEAAIYKYNC